MSLRAGRSGVKKSQVDPVSGNVKVEMPTEIDATTVNEVGIRVNPDDSDAIQYKTPNGDWRDFSSGGSELELLWEDLNPQDIPSTGRTINVNSTDYSALIIVCKGDNLVAQRDAIGFYNKLLPLSLITGSLKQCIGYIHVNGNIWVAGLVVTDSTVKIEQAFNGSNYNGRWIVPVRIYGLK